MRVEEAINKMLSAAAEEGFTKTSLARLCGLSVNALRGLDFSPSASSRIGSANPTVATLLAIQNLVDPEPYLLDGPSSNTVEIRAYVEGQKTASSQAIESQKFYLDRDAAMNIDRGQIAKVRRASEQWSGPDGRIPEAALNRDMLKTIAPQSAVHIIRASDPRPEGFEYEIWDTDTGWGSGQDFSGQRISQASDALLRDCTFEDFMVVRELGWPSLAAISRRFSSGVERKFLRYLHPIAGTDGSNKILCVCRPKEFQA